MRIPGRNYLLEKLIQRPMLLAAGLCLAAILCDLFFGLFASILLALLVIPSFGLYLKHNHIPMWNIVVAIIIPVIIIKTEYQMASYSLVDKLDKEKVYASVSGEVKSVSKSDKGYSLIIKNAVFEPNDLDYTGPKLTLLVYVSDGDYMIGDRYSFYGEIQNFERPRNPGEFNVRNYYHSQGIQYLIKAKSSALLSEGQNSIYRWCYEFRNNIKSIFSRTYSEKNVGVMDSIILGDKTELDRNVKYEYQRNGIAHMLAISGLHISLIGVLLYKLLLRRFSFLISGSVALFTIGVFLVLTGNAVSAKRAVIMLAVIVLADILGRSSDLANTLGFAACLILVENPYYIMNSGFQMSFLAYAGIVFIYPIFSNKHTIFLIFRMPNEKDCNIFTMLLFRIIDGLILSLCIQLATLPIILNSTYQVPVIGVILNLIVIPLLSVVMVSGLITGIVGLFSINIAIFFAGAGTYILNFYELLCKLADNIRLGVILSGKPSDVVLIVYVIICICLVMFKNKILITGCLILLFPFLGYNSPRGITVTMLDVGQGDCTVIQTHGGTTFLFDAGSSSRSKAGKNIVYQYLKYTGEKSLDYIFVSHTDEDHINGVLELLEVQDSTFEIKNMVLPDIRDKERDEKYQLLCKKAVNRGVKLHFVKAGDRLSVDGVSISCLHPCIDYDYSSANDYSAIFKLEYEQFSMLMMGDAEKEAEECMIRDNKLGNMDVLKVGHHGSKSSSTDSLLNIVRPQIALISCGINNKYGHPNKEIIDRLNSIDSRIFRTDMSGAITLYIDNNNINIETFV